MIGDEELKFISPCVAHLDIVAPMLQTLDLTFLTWLQSLHLTAVSPELLYRGLVNLSYDFTRGLLSW